MALQKLVTDEKEKNISAEFIIEVISTAQNIKFQSQQTGGIDHDLKILFELDEFTKNQSINSEYRLKDLSCSLVEAAEVLIKKDFMQAEKIIRDIYMLIAKYDTRLSLIKNAYMGYVIAPNKKFVNRLIEEDSSEVFYKSTDSDISILFKKMYLRYQKKRFEDLNNAEKKLGTEEEYHLFQKALEEFHSRNYRTSLWKTEEEYRLFLQQIEKDLGMTYEEINRAIVNELIFKEGYSIDFEDVLEYRTVDGEQKIRAKDEVYLNYPKNSTMSDAGRNYNRVFGFLGEGMVICIQNPKYKRFSDLNIRFGSDILCGKKANGLAKFGQLFEDRKKKGGPFPYIFYDEEKVLVENEKNSKEKLLSVLKAGIIKYICTRVEGGSYE